MSRKVILLLLFILIAVPSNQVLAHTSLRESLPNDGESVTESIQDLRLIFSTRIEQTSRIEVKDSTGTSITLEGFVIEEDEIRATFPQPLKNGTYDVTWMIVGADGHPIEGTFSFNVSIPNNGIEEKDQKNVDGNQEDSIKQTIPEIKQSNLPPYVIPIITGVLLIIVAGSTFWLIRRKS